MEPNYNRREQSACRRGTLGSKPIKVGAPLRGLTHNRTRAAGVTPKLWEIADMVKVLEDWEAALDDITNGGPHNGAC
jgi:hypothetical protein